MSRRTEMTYNAQLPGMSAQHAAVRRVADQPDPDANLLERILSRPNMLKAWERVKANKGAPGMDNMPIADFMAFAREHWKGIRASILVGTYQPLPVKRVEIPKPTGGTRPLGIPTVLDRLIQQAMAQVLLPICRNSSTPWTTTS